MRVRLLALLALSFPLAASAATPPTGETLAFGRFGTVHLYRPSGQPSNVVLFISGDGGWNLGVVDMARALSSLDALVVGIDITHYLPEAARSSEECTYAAADFEGLSQLVQKKLDLPHYLPPVLVGYSSGATLAYATLVEGPPGTFAGAISMGFCPDLPLSKPLCKGAGLGWQAKAKGRGVVFEPAPGLTVPWIAFQGEIDRVCDAQQVVAFVKHVGSADVVLLPKVGHGFSVQANWLPQFRSAFERIAEGSRQATPATADALNDLPLVEIEPQGEMRDMVAVILSGDGGWASLDRQVGNALAAQGYPVIGLNSLQYFWHQRTPVEAASDLARIVNHGLREWHAQGVILVGYSLGADVLPFMAAGLPPELRQRVRLVALIGPGTTASFEFHLSDWLGGGNQTERPIAPQIKSLEGTRVLCLFGSQEKDSLCPTLDPSWSWVKRSELGGGHHMGGDYQSLAATILADLPPPSAQP